MTDYLGPGPENSHWFGTWVYYDTEEEKAEAKTYLDLWMKFTLKYLSRRCPNLIYVDFTLITRDPNSTCNMLGNVFPVPSMLCMKIQMKGDLEKNAENQYFRCS